MKRTRIKENNFPWQLCEEPLIHIDWAEKASLWVCCLGRYSKAELELGNIRGWTFLQAEGQQWERHGDRRTGGLWDYNYASLGGTVTRSGEVGRGKALCDGLCSSQSL